MRKWLRKKRGIAREAPEAPESPYGLKVWHDCPGATADICFVHGLNGNRDSTWTAAGQSAPWPQTLLPPELGNARILAYGYDADVVRAPVASTIRLNGHATNFMTDLAFDRLGCNAASRPLIFVAHSLGGLISKEAILLSRNNPDHHLCDIFDSTKGIIFMGTPQGMPVRAISVVKSVNRKLLEVLEPDHQYLESIQSRFLNMIREQREGGRPLEVTCFFEELPLSVGRVVVSRESATFDSFSPIAIHADHREMVRFASAEDPGFRALLGILRLWISQVGNAHRREGRTEAPSDCLKSLAFPEMDSRFRDVRQAHPKTCGWLLKHDTYKRWAAYDRGLLWIKGKPGSGKSTLLKYALDNHRGGAMPDASSESNDLILSFFFHNRGGELQKTPLGLFRSLLHQVLREVPYASPALVEVFETRRREMGEPGEKWQWHQEELPSFFRSSLAKILETRSVWLFVDALDECGKDNAIDLVESFKLMLGSLESLSTGCLGQFHICFTCRPYPILDLDGDGFEICPATENGGDISTFVDDRLSAFCARTSSAIPALIKERAAGVFLWACLVVKRVLDLEREGVGLRKIEAAVYAIPLELDELYKQLILSMRSRASSLKLIQWVICAMQPLSVDELRWAMVIDADCPYKSLRECQSAEDYVSDDSQMTRRVQTLSCGLAEVTATQVVQFIHQTVKDFFFEKGLSLLDNSSPSLTTNMALGRAHFRLSRICIRYLAMEEIEFPFLPYAAQYWAVHTKCSDEDSVPQDDLLELFDWPSSALVERWSHVFGALHLEYGSSICPADNATLLHVMSMYGVSGVVTAIITKADQTATDIDTRDNKKRTPLSYAAQYGHLAVAKLLLDTEKVDIDSKDTNGQTPLSWAAEHGQEAVTKVLLDTGKVDIDAKDDQGLTPLSWAALRGHLAVVKVLLDTGKVDIDSKDDKGRTLLSWAAECGQEAVMKVLLDTGKVDIDSKDNQGRTPLSWAAREGCEDVVKFLLDTGKVDIDSKDDKGRTPLSWAAECGQEAVKFLLDTGKVDINSKDNQGRTPLSWAAGEGCENVADIDSRDEDGRTPLWHAVKTGGIESLKRWGGWGYLGGLGCIELLLGTGKVDINSKDNEGHSPLSLATGREHTGWRYKRYKDIVKLLESAK
ncbi:ankyrin repeat domain-containing protein 17 [Diplogelasinospora grovesii]|uniref:Ankyrin repeat domain-containing protein 17 n=1 Tax=Diplogelasinospora grovesii TaxID=303347 RepID=A0AAN6S8P9_9PEZI|nr:ankyrin repeat domain-containing protein 17 [Diplogelasinospora grovesii]